MDEPLKSVLLRSNDARLAALILAETEDEGQDALERIVVDHARPVIDAVLSRTRNSILRARRAVACAVPTADRSQRELGHRSLRDLLHAIGGDAGDGHRAVRALASPRPAVRASVLLDAIHRRRRAVGWRDASPVRAKLLRNSCVLRDFRSWRKPLIRLRHLLPARRGEKGDKLAQRKPCCPSPREAGRGCRRRVRGRATSDALSLRQGFLPSGVQ